MFPGSQETLMACPSSACRLGPYTGCSLRVTLAATEDHCLDQSWQIFSTKGQTVTILVCGPYSWSLTQLLNAAIVV